MNEDGTVTVKVGTSAHGQGHDTAFSMVVSDVLGIPMDKVVLVQSDTGQVPRGNGTMGSRSLQTAGSAVQVASEVVLAKARTLAAHLLEANEVDLVVADGGLQVAGSPTAVAAWGDLARLANDDDRRPEGVERGLFHENDFDGTDSTFPFGAHVAVVEIDRETGGVRLIRHVAVDDCGRILNPLLVAGQQHGGIAQGAAQALFEWVRYDAEGNPLTTSFVDYLMPERGRAAELRGPQHGDGEPPQPARRQGHRRVGHDRLHAGRAQRRGRRREPSRRPPHRHALLPRAHLGGTPLGRHLDAPPRLDGRAPPSLAKVHLYPVPVRTLASGVTASSWTAYPGTARPKK